MIKFFYFISFFVVVFSSVHSSENQKDEEISMNLIAKNCNGCHGWDAKGVENLYSITKLSYDHFIERMMYFKKDKNNSVMKRILDVFSENDIINLADFYYKKEISE